MRNVTWRAGVVEPLVKLVEAGPEGKAGEDSHTFKAEMVQHLLTLQVSHPQLREAIQEVSLPALLHGRQLDADVMSPGHSQGSNSVKCCINSSGFRAHKHSGKAWKMPCAAPPNKESQLEPLFPK